MNRRLLAWTTFLVGMCCISGACKKNGDSRVTGDTDTIRIGEIGSMTGAEATFGTATHQGIELAVRQINESGGIQGKKIQLITLDDQGKPEESASAAAHLISQKKVSALIGAVGSSKSLAIAPISQKNKIPQVCPDSTNPKVTEIGNFIFRVCFTDPFQGGVIARFALEQLHLKKAAIIRDMKSDYSVGLATFFTQKFREKGGEVVADQSYNAGDIDFKSLLTAIRAKNPEFIFIPGYYTEVGLIARQARELGINIPLIGGDGWDSPKLIEIAGPAIENSYFSNHYSEEGRSEKTKKFIHDFQQAHGKIPDGLSALGFDSVLVLADAMKRAQSLNPTDIRASLAKTADFEGVTGKITLDENRNPIKSVVMIQIRHGKFKYLTVIDP